MIRHKILAVGDAFVEIVMIGNKYLVSCFRLAGVDILEASSDEDATKKLEQLISEGKYKIFIITEKISRKAKSLREDLLKAKKPYPLFLIIPDFEGPLKERITELNEYVNQAMGVKLKL